MNERTINFANHKQMVPGVPVHLNVIRVQKVNKQHETRVGNVLHAELTDVPDVRVEPWAACANDTLVRAETIAFDVEGYVGQFVVLGAV